jgi:hypothetical protein
MLPQLVRMIVQPDIPRRWQRRWRREQHRHSLRLPLPSILKHLSIGRTPARSFLLRSVAALILKLAAIEAHKLNRRRMDA